MSPALRYCSAQGMVKCWVSSRWRVRTCSFWSCGGPNPLTWWGRGQITSSRFMSSLVSPQCIWWGFHLSEYGSTWGALDWWTTTLSGTCAELVCIAAETGLTTAHFTATAALVSYIKHFRWNSSCFQKSVVVQKQSAFRSDFLNSLTKVKRALDITQAAVSKNSLLSVNQCCLYNVVVTVPPGFAPPVLLAHAATVCHALVNHNRLFPTLPYIFLGALLLWKLCY